MKVHVFPHDPAWEAEFIRVRDDLYNILKDVPILSIEHVGSTSVPDLIAKPLLDIDIVINREALSAARAAMVAAGYTDRGELSVPERFLFRQPGIELLREAFALGEKPMEMIRNTYVTLEGSVALKNHRDVKRVLLQDAGLREEYGNVKKQLAATEWENMDEYCRGKNKILMKILKSAGWNEKELEEVRKSNEWSMEDRGMILAQRKQHLAAV